MDELNDIFILDSNDATIDLGTFADLHDFFVRAKATDTARKCEYITVQKLVPKGSELDEHGNPVADIASSTFAVNKMRFVDEIKLFWGLEYTNDEWFSKQSPASEQWVRKKIQDALLPFGISKRDQDDLYYQLQLYCSRSDAPSAPDVPAWLSGRSIKEAEFAKYLIEKTGWKKTGNIIRTTDNQIVTYETARRTIALEIAPYFPTSTTSKISKLLRMVLILLPEVDFEERLDIISAKELAEENPPPPQFIVDKILPEGLCILAADYKIGKSWLCLALADAIATGDNFLGFNVQKGSSLYLALEDSKNSALNRLNLIGSDMPDAMKIVTSTTKQLDSGLLMQLESWLDETEDARVIIIDTLMRVRPSTVSGLDAYQNDSMLLGPLQKMALNRHIAVIVVTHYSKSVSANPFDNITGSKGQGAIGDTIWTISGEHFDEEKTLSITGHFSESGKYKISFDKNTRRWLFIGTTEEIEEQRRRDAYKVDPIARTIKTMVNQNGRWQVSAQEMAVEVARLTQTAFEDHREIGVKVAKMTDLLLKDGIMWTKAPGGKRGRGYCFERTNQMI